MLLSILEVRTLFLLKENGYIPTGKGLIKYVAAARRLERKGLVGQSSLWYVTNAGERFITHILNMEGFELTDKEKEKLQNSWWNVEKEPAPK